MLTSAACSKVGRQPEYPDPPSCLELVGETDAADSSGEASEILPGPDSAPGLKAALDKLEKPCSPTDEQREEALETIRKRRRAKSITADLLEELEALDSPIPYGRARSCCEVLKQEDGQLTTNYCRCRWCIVCNRIRMGTVINRYLPIFKLWEEEKGVHFVTLTRPNVPAGELEGEISEMKRQLRYCRRSIRETREMDYRAVENWEVTYNSDREDYNPHVHCAVRGKEQAIALREEWLKRSSSASEAGQDVRKWDGTVGGMKEMAKYATKMIAPEEGEDGPPVEALDTIFRALHRKHLCSPAGFEIEEEQARAELYFEDKEIGPEATADPEADEQEGDHFEELEARVPAFSRPEEDIVWEWDPALSDWVDPETGECISGSEPGG